MKGAPASSRRGSPCPRYLPAPIPPGDLLPAPAPRPPPACSPGPRASRTLPGGSSKETAEAAEGQARPVHDRTQLRDRSAQDSGPDCISTNTQDLQDSFRACRHGYSKQRGGRPASSWHLEGLCYTKTRVVIALALTDLARPHPRTRLHASTDPERDRGTSHPSCHPLPGPSSWGGAGGSKRSKKVT